MAEWRKGAFVWLALTAAACSVEEGADPFALARLCDPSRSGVSCGVEGDAEQTTGLTQDGIAFRIGPDGGRVLLPLRAAAFASVTGAAWSLEALIAGTDADATVRTLEITWRDELPDASPFGVVCPPQCPRPIPGTGEVNLGRERAWVRIVDDAPGTALAPVPNGAALTIEGRNVDILDLRFP